mmetsp:Transcript_25736/g.64870  ORF Transcript_25736/g.64870 Transcript_25736/m.64870 type:complete len:585 (-) Transcript_25736:761-2515(-)|eukprot:CAMPEP_0113874500 /NCGR_PEP_ID=MMETSP0780_2-20120614/4369_1 /TAXON_ID=652834 /ORGANISM="Palpitomonas bilix" /LENGTH=584 /DNA_ID=CAMNT_0000860281 /DNA_START=1314 /DNA_END=3068 /DNA_ORIENTATION=+ /assembly_acc=CAM_ASM_000599
MKDRPLIYLSLLAFLHLNVMQPHLLATFLKGTWFPLIQARHLDRVLSRGSSGKEKKESEGEKERNGAQTSQETSSPSACVPDPEQKEDSAESDFVFDDCTNVRDPSVASLLPKQDDQQRTNTICSLFGTETATRILREHTGKKIVPQQMREALEKAREQFAQCKKAGVELIHMGEIHYPLSLKRTASCPPLLFVRGNKACLRSFPCLGMGTRPSKQREAEGKRVVQQFAAEMARQRHFPVVGFLLSYATDVEALHTFLEHHDPNGEQVPEEEVKRPIAILEHNLLIEEMPPPMAALNERIIRCGGCVISERPPGQPVTSLSVDRTQRLLWGICEETLLVNANTRHVPLLTLPPTKAGSSRGSESDSSSAIPVLLLWNKNPFFNVPVPIRGEIPACNLWGDTQGFHQWKASDVGRVVPPQAIFEMAIRHSETRKNEWVALGAFGEEDVLSLDPPSVPKTSKTTLSQENTNEGVPRKEKRADPSDGFDISMDAAKKAKAGFREYVGRKTEARPSLKANGGGRFRDEQGADGNKRTQLEAFKYQSHRGESRDGTRTKTHLHTKQFGDGKPKLATQEVISTYFSRTPR